MFLPRLPWLTVIFGICAAERKLDLCKEPAMSCGPVPPVLPTSFIMKGSILDLTTSNVTWFEEYFDPDNLRGKYVEVSKGQEIHRIYNYLTEQIVSYFTIHPGATPRSDAIESLTCYVERMGESPFRDLLGMKTFGHYDELRPRMYDAYQSLRYGGPYTFSFDQANQVDRDRNVPCKTFTGCVYDENQDATFDMTFSWLGDQITPAFAVSAMPLRIREHGGYYSSNGGPTPVWNPVNTEKTIAWFEANPYMDNAIFQIPERMECKDMRSSEPVRAPSMPNAFSTRMESFITTENWKGNVVDLTKDVYQELWYDWNRKLIRHDHTFSGMEDLFLLTTFDKETMVTSVHDFNSGLSFYTDKVQGLCLYFPIIYQGDNLILSDQSTEHNVIMAAPQQILNIDESLKFKGTYKIRDMDCNGWTTRVNKTSTSKNDPVTLLHEIYSTKDGWHQDINGLEDFEVPVKDVELYSSIVEGQSAEVIVETNYYKFLPHPPPLSVYDISGCAINAKKKYLKVDLKVTKKPDAMKDKDVVNDFLSSFLDSAQMALTEGADLGSPLRIQDLQVVEKGDGSLGLSFTMLDVFDKKGSVSTPIRGQELDKAKQTLETKINTGTGIFSIVTDARMGAGAEFMLVPKTLEEISRKITYENLSKAHYVSDPTTVKKTDKTDKSDPASKGYSKGQLAGLSIGMLILGLAIGTGLMMFYFKRFMKPKDNTETADFALNEST